ncbi:MAG: acetate--CoA ligase family protein [Nitrososphaerota archaeon]|nr:acetate--CoA ligase family protein [Aigarchaeota archaeon]MDW8076382.1 acetate--CoA ligase family protein [Nitrososphaerota archaeon]
MRGLEYLIRPRTVAVVGASREPTKIGHVILKNILENGFPRTRVFPINPNVDEVLGLKCYPSLKDVPSELDLAVIVVPANVVPKIVEDCVEKGVKFAAIISSGFREVGNVDAEKRIVEIARKGGVRILGPNIVGLIDTVVNLNASFLPYLPDRGEIVMISQSGALSAALLTWTKVKGIGLLDIISLGNKADIDECELIEFFSKDPYTKAITIYMEGVDDGKRFMEVARRVGREKPIIILKAGKGRKAAEAVKSHTGSLAGSDVAYDAAFKQCGIIRAGDIRTLFDYALSLAMLPDPKGENVAIVTNGGGVGVMCADACEELNLHLMEIPEDLASALREWMPSFGSTLNPIDLTGMATEKEYYGALSVLLKDERVHAVITLFSHPATLNPTNVAEAIASCVAEMGKNKPIIAAFIGGKECDDATRFLIKNGIPTFDTPERAAAALATKYKYVYYKSRPTGKRLEVEREKERAYEIIARAVKEGRNLTQSESCEVARLYGIPTPKKFVAKNLEEAIKLADNVGYPVVLEVESPDIIHKTDVGAIKLNIKDKKELEYAYNEIIKSVVEKVPSAKIEGVVVRSFIKEGAQVAVGMHRDDVFGPVIMFGSGGVTIELYKDVSFRIAPLTDVDVEEMMNETKIYKILKGFRGTPKDVDSVKSVLAAVNQLALDFDVISDVDINPLFVYEDGCMAFDVKIMLRGLSYSS